MRIGRPQPHTLVGAYTMDALDRRDAARFERHLARCQECAREISGLREATAALAAAAALRPAVELKQRVLAQTARTRQLSPFTGRQARPGWRVVGRRRVRPAGRRRLAHRLVLAVVALVMAGAVAVWAAGYAGRHRASGVPPEVAAVLTAPDATMLTAAVRTGGHATIVMSRHEHMLVFAAAGLRGLSPSQCYELWLMGRHGDRPAGLLPMPRHGMTGPTVASGLEPGDRLGLSVEPATGAAHPTTPMIIVVAL